MNSNRFVWSLFFFLHFMIALQIVYYAPQLPPQMASHFNGAGQANAYQSKAGFIGFYIGLVLLMSGIFAGLGLLLPKIPVRLINIPNKDYWFVGECAHESFIFLTRQMIRLANANALFFLVLFQLLIQVNIQVLPGTKPVLGNVFWIYFALYLLYVLLWIIGLLSRYRLPPEVQMERERKSYS